VASRAPADRTADTDRTVRSHRPDRAETANGTGRPDASPRAGRADRIGRAEARTAPPPPPRSPARAPGRDPANGHHPDRPGDADAAGNAAQADARRAGTTGSAPTAGGPAPAAPGHPPESTPGASCPACRRPLTDPLTGALDRFSWEAAAPLIAAARRDGAPVALVLADLDGFKGVNDRYGHPAGDAVLSTTGSVLRALAAEVDGALVGRYGSWAGDEFLILLPGARVADALALAHRAAREVRAARVEAPAGRQATVTLTGQRVSLGVAGVRHVPDPGPGAGGHATDVLRALVLDADAALRAAKRAGGGRVHVQADPAEDPAGAAPEPYAPPGGGTGGTAGTGPLDSVRIALPPDEVRLHGAGPAELVLTPAAAEHLHAVLSELLTRPHSREDR
jgi:diguanylate cyclase (GGDEF)-like protein